MIAPYTLDQQTRSNLREVLVDLDGDDASGSAKGAAVWVCRRIESRSKNMGGNEGSLMRRARIELTATSILLNTCDDDAHRGWFLQVARCVPGCFEPVA
jgi:hypothetical protein